MDPSTRAKLLGLFVSEADQTLSQLDRQARALPDEADPAALQEFGRLAHGLKGAASAVGLAPLAGCLHELERVALQPPAAGPTARSEQRERLGVAIELLRDGVAAMAGSGRDAFPPELLERAVLTLRGEAPVAGTPATAPGPSPAPPAAPPAAGEAFAERLSVPAEEIDAALRQITALSRGLAALQEQLLDSPAAASLRSLGTEASRLEAAIASLWLMPARDALAGIEEEVARLVQSLGKEARLTVRGADVRADRRTLATARRLLGHLIRNALDHGLEAPAARFAAGKPVAGQLTVTFELVDTAVRVTVEDDGAGFDLDAVRARLVRQGESRQELTALADAELLRRFALAGGSTREEATLVSGRGLGLSAVASLARAAGGDVELRSARGAGSTVAFTLPPEVYALEVLVVACQGRLVGLPAAAVERVVLLEPGKTGPAARTLAVGESILPFSPLPALLGESGEAAAFAVVMRGAEGLLAVGVEEVGTLEWGVPHALPGVAGKDERILGISRLGDGRVLLVLNPRRLAPVQVAAAAASSTAAPSPQTADAASLEIVLAEDSPATREVLRVLLTERGYRVRLASDGEEALCRVAERTPDVVVTDLNMPRADGLALTRALRARPETARLPVVLLTSQDDDATRAAGAAAGADAYLVKSRFNAEVLEQTLLRLGVRRPA
ncbi:MAG: response regulator [Myxococcales bacterium]